MDRSLRKGLLKMGHVNKTWMGEEIWRQVPSQREEPG